MNKIEAPTTIDYGVNRYGFDPMQDYYNFCVALIVGGVCVVVVMIGIIFAIIFC